MAKELPFFKFTIQEWQNGKISTLNDSLKGVFIDVCCYYWAQNCNVNYDMLICKFKTKEKSIQKLIESQTIQGQFIDETKQIGIVSISFLDQQLTECKQTNSFFSEMGKLGQKTKKLKAPLNPDLSYKIRIREDKDKEDFEIFRSSFLGTKKGFEIEFENFKKKNPNYHDILPLLLPALKKEIEVRDYRKTKGLFVAEWKHLSTWINQKCWTQELESIPKEPDKPKEVLDLDGHFATFQHFGYEGYLARLKETNQKVRLNAEGKPI